MLEDRRGSGRIDHGGECVFISAGEFVTPVGRVRMKRRMALVGMALLAVILVAQAGAPGRALAQPQIKEAKPANGETLDTPPESLHLCFSEPVNVESDWKFTVRSPDNTSLGLRIVFQPSGECVDVYPGAVAPEAAKGIWTFDWLVTSQASKEEGSGTIKFQVGGDFGLTPEPTPRPEGSGDGGDGGIGTLGIALIVAAGVIAAGSVGLLAYGRARRGRR